MSNQPLVSVIIPTFNRAHLIARAIDSVLNQSYKNLELIVVDDGSVDDTNKVLEGYADIKRVVQANKGQAAARNAGLKITQGSLIACLDSDDFWSPTFLENCVAELVEQQLDFVFTNWFQETQEGNWIDSFERYFFLDEFGNKQEEAVWVKIEYPALKKLYLKYCPSPSSSFVIRKELIAKGWNNNMNIADDWCLLLDLIVNHPCKVAFTRSKLWHKGRNEDNICDGRSVIELVDQLYVRDTKSLMDRYEQQLGKAEYELLKVVYIENLIKLGIHHILRERAIRKGIALISKALKDDFRLSCVGVQNIWSRKKEWVFHKMNNNNLIQRD